MFLLIILGLLAVMQVFILNKYSTTGEKITFLLSEVKKIEKENSKLGQKIASAAAIVAISNKAEKLGLSKSVTLLSLTSPLPVAYDLRSSL